jgi:hypothetical protein
MSKPLQNEFKSIKKQIKDTKRTELEEHTSEVKLKEELERELYFKNKG